MMALLLESLTTEELMEAASQAEKHQPITDSAIQELLKRIARVGSTASVLMSASPICWHN